MTDPTRADPDVGAIRRAALAATPGPWFTTGSPWFTSADGVLAGSPDGNAGFMIADCETFGLSRDEYEGPLTLSTGEADAAYIALMHPPTTLALLDAYEAEKARAVAAEKRAAELEDDLDRLRTRHDDMIEYAKTFNDLAEAAEKRAAELEERVFCPECQHQQKTDELMKEAAKRLRDIHGYEPGTRFISKGGKVVVVYGAALDGWIHYRLEKKSGGGSSEPAFFHEEHARLLDPAHTAETGGDRG